MHLQSATLSVGGRDTASGDIDNEIVVSRSEDDTADDATTDQPMVTSVHNESIESVDSPSDEGIQNTTKHEATVDAPCDDGDNSGYPLLKRQIKAPNNMATTFDLPRLGIMHISAIPNSSPSPQAPIVNS